MNSPLDGIGHWPVFDDDTSWNDAHDVLEKAGLSDGQPLVPPTINRLSAMSVGVSDPVGSHGHMPPLFRELNAAVVAYSCVLAGCAPGAVPVVLIASIACLDPYFNLLGLATTTGAPAVATIVHGPVAEALGMNGGVNCLAPGNRANATLGRAISLVLRNVAGMCTGAADMATMGQPGKYGFCFPESVDTIFPPFHARQGFDRRDSAVTVLGVSGTVEVLPSLETGNWDAPEMVLNPVALMMRATLVAGGGARKSERREQVLLLPPELAALMVQRSWTIDAIQKYLCNDAPTFDGGPIAHSPDDIHVIVTGGAGVKMTVLPPWGGGTRAVTRQLVAT